MKQFVSVIIPTRNEEKFIARCLDSIISQDYSKEYLEVFVINGISEDRTKEIVKFYSEKHNFIKVLENPDKTTPFAMNMGIKNAKGDIIIKIDAHAIYEKGYISKCVECLKKYNADNVGGVLKTVPAKDTLIAKAIALCLSSFFGAGNSYFRTGAAKAMDVDTVSFGCYKKEVFDKIGLYNENLSRSQDMELNARLKKAGGKIILCPEITAYYYPKDNLKDFFLHNFSDGVWAILPLKYSDVSFKLRHYIPALFLSLLVLSLFFDLFPFLVFLYFFASFYFSFNISRKEKDAKLFFVLPVVFFTRHFGYGLGSIWGLIKLLF